MVHGGGESLPPESGTGAITSAWRSAHHSGTYVESGRGAGRSWTCH